MLSRRDSCCATPDVLGVRHARRQPTAAGPFAGTVWQGIRVRSNVHALWERYLAAERAGYRPRSLAVLSDLLAAVRSVDDRDRLAAAVFRSHERRDGTLPTLRGPLVARVLRPYVREHLTEPQVLWWALRTRTFDHEQLEMFGGYDRIGGSATAGAITYAISVTGEPRWWRELLDFRLGLVDFATHHLDEGRLVGGSVAACVRQLCAAIATVDQAPTGAIGPAQLDSLRELWSLLRDWLRYEEGGRPGDDFPSWCRTRGSDHWVARSTTTRHFYYQR